MQDLARGVVIAGIGLLPALAMAATTRPALVNAATKPSAKVSDQAREVLSRLSDAYGKLESLELGGVLSLVVEDGSGKHTQETEFIGIYRTPDRFRHEAKTQPLLGSTGQKVFAYSQQTGVYRQMDVGPGKLMVGELPGEVAAILPVQNPSLALAIARDADALLGELAEQIDAAGLHEIEGRSYTSLALVLRKDKSKLTLLIDPQTHLIRRAITDIAGAMRQQGRGDIKAAVFSVDYRTARAGVEIAPDRFVWSAPEGARDLSATGALVAEATEGNERGSPAMALVGKPAPDFTIEGLDGQSVTLSALKGSVVVLDFWASWCGPCVASLPRLEKIHSDYVPRGLKLYAVNLRETQDKVRSFVDAQKLTMPVLLDNDGDVADRYLAHAIPQTVIIGRDGVIRKVIVGFNPAADADLRRLIDEQLERKVEDPGKAAAPQFKR